MPYRRPGAIIDPIPTLVVVAVVIDESYTDSLAQTKWNLYFSTANEAIINGARNGFVAATANNGAAIGKNS